MWLSAGAYSSTYIICKNFACKVMFTVSPYYFCNLNLYLFFSTVRFATPTHRAHGFNHGLSPFGQYPHRPVYPQYYSSPHIHRATSTIFTPGGSLGSNVASCSGFSAVTQDETKLKRLSVDEVMRADSQSR